MKVRRYILTIAVADGEAARLTEKVIEDAVNHGLDLEPGTGYGFIALADERTVDYPDPAYVLDADAANDAAFDAWTARAESECTEARR